MFSAAVMAVAWFELPVQRLVSDAIRFQEGIRGWKTWLAALVVLAYLVLRYRFSGQAQALSDAIKEQQDKTHWSGVWNLVNAAADDAYTNAAVNKVVGIQLQTAKQQDDAMVLAHAQVANFRPQVNYAIERGPTMWAGQVTVWVSDAGNGNKTVGAKHVARYTVPEWPRRRLVAAGFYRSWIYSAASVNVVSPYLFALIAASVIVTKLATTA